MLSMKLNNLICVPYITLANINVIIRYCMVVIFSVCYVEILIFSIPLTSSIYLLLFVLTRMI